MFEPAQILLLLSFTGTKVLASGIDPPATPCDDQEALKGVWREGCLVQTCKAGTVVESLAEECLKLIEKRVEDALDENCADKELVYLGNTIVKLPSFEQLSKCKLPPHPNKELTKATTGVLDGKVITCGGEVESEWPSEYFSNCYKLEKGTWSALPDMKQKRARAASSVTSNGEFLVTGGETTGQLALNTTEIYKNGVWEKGPELPVKMLGHCQLTTKSGVIVAGIDGMDISNFLVFRLEGGEWKMLKEEKQRKQKWVHRIGHSCQMLPDDRLAVLGGYGDLTWSFDILDLNTLTWTKGPDLPFNIFDDFSAIYNDSIYLIGKELGEIYSLSTDLDGDWLYMKSINPLEYMVGSPAPIVRQNDIC